MGFFLCFQLTCGWGKVGVPRVGPPGWGPEGPEGWDPEGWGTRRVGARNFAFFFPCPAAKFVLFFPLCGSRGRVVFEAPGRSNVHVWSSLSCASPGGPVWWGRRGFTPFWLKGFGHFGSSCSRASGGCCFVLFCIFVRRRVQWPVQSRLPTSAQIPGTPPPPIPQGRWRSGDPPN